MVFSSLLFLFVFLPVVLLLYFLAPKGYRNFILFISSLIFYAWGEPVYVVIMLFSTVVDFTHGMLVKNFKDKGNMRAAKLTLLSAVSINLMLLFFFKYSDFVIMNINAIFGTELALLNLALPIGISFYTFQTMSYTIDIYRGDADVQKNIIDFGAYVALFPQLIAGPIVRYKTIAEQLRERTEDFQQCFYGIKRFLIGLGKKVLLANSLGLLWRDISGGDIANLSLLSGWLGIIAFALQIYFDFSGYSDMAIGLGSIFGFKFLENFDYPYISKSITEFWRRWHISLGTWFKEYVYIPLGGNKKGFSKQIRNIAIVWFLTGLWHGASWNYILWGLYFAFFLVIEKLFLLKLLKRAPRAVSNAYTLVLVLFSWVIFAFESLPPALQYFRAMLGLAGGGIINNQGIYYLSTNLILLVICIAAASPWPSLIANKALERLKERELLTAMLENMVLLVIFLLCTAYLVDGSYNPFLYFRF